MARELKPSAPGVNRVRRLIAKEAEKALDVLAKLGSVDAELSTRDAVHDVRKRLKRARAMLRLIRPALGDKVYQEENECFRDVARPLTEVRDVDVLVTTFDKYCRNDERVEREALNSIKQSLLVREQEVKGRVLENKDGLAQAREALKDGLECLEDWKSAKHGWAVLGKGLKRVYRSGRDAHAAAREEASVANLHEWRKQAKYLRYQLEVVRPIWPLVLDDLVAKTKALGDLLGDDHDLAVLRDELRDKNRYPAQDAVNQLEERIVRERGELERRAFETVKAFYDARPSAFVNRLEEPWRLWQKRPKAIAGAAT